MEDLIKGIYEITLGMKLALKEEKYEDYLNLLNNRGDLMSRVDKYRAEYPEYLFNNQDRTLLKEIQQLDEELNKELKENLNQTAIELKQVKQNKQVSMKYKPYSKQTNGIFIDSKK